MSYLGSWKIDDLLTFYANTTRFDTGAATDADSPATYRIYEDETATPILTGTMALLDSANTAGFYSEQIALSAANGFEKGKSYAIYIQATVNSVVGATHHTLQMEAEVDANTVSPTVSANVTQLNGVAQSLLDLKDFADDGYDPATNKVQGVVLTDTVTTYTGNTPQTGDVFPLASTEIADIKAKTDNLPIDPADESSIQATLATISAYIDTEVAAIKAKTDNLPAAPAATGDIPTANQNADALLDRANGIETGLTPRQAMRLFAAALAGKLSGAATVTVTIRNAVVDDKNRIIATVDGDGNRSAIIYDLT